MKKEIIEKAIKEISTLTNLTAKCKMILYEKRINKAIKIVNETIKYFTMISTQAENVIELFQKNELVKEEYEEEIKILQVYAKTLKEIVFDLKELLDKFEKTTQSKLIDKIFNLDIFVIFSHLIPQIIKLKDEGKEIFNSKEYTEMINNVNNKFKGASHPRFTPKSIRKVFQ